MRNGTSRLASAGLTLVELMIAMVLSLVLMAAVYLLYQVQSSSSNTQGNVSQMQQDLRLSMDVMEKDIRMAGYDPKNSKQFGIVTASAHELALTVDSNTSGAVDNGERITYSLVGGALNRTESGSSAVAIANNVTALDFTYYDRSGDPTATLASIRAIKVSLATRSSKPDPESGAYLERKLERRIRCRNLGL